MVPTEHLWRSWRAGLNSSPWPLSEPGSLEWTRVNDERPLEVNDWVGTLYPQAEEVHTQRVHAVARLNDLP